MEAVEKYIDHTFLKQDAADSSIKKLCAEAVKYGFASVCVNPCNVRFCAKQLKNTGVKVCSVVGFPLGASTARVKAFEAADAADNGADEIDMVMNIGAMKSGKYPLVLADIRKVRKAVPKKLLKVIIETCLLTEKEKIIAAKLVTRAKADFIKTSTGFSSAGAVVKDIKLLRKHIGKGVRVKASGGIKTRMDALDMIKAGADRIGTSASVEIAANKSPGKRR